MNTTSIKDRSFVMNISNGNDISIETRKNKDITGISVFLTQKGKRIYALDLEYINGRFVRLSDAKELEKLPRYDDLPEEEKIQHEGRTRRTTI